MEMSDEEILEVLKKTNNWISDEAIKAQGCSVDDITIREECYRRDQPGIFRVSYRCYDPEREGEPFSQQYWYGEFAIRGPGGNPTALGKKLGIKTRDKRISVFSQEGRDIEKLLHRIAWVYACRLTEDRSKISDRTYLANNY